MKTKICEFLFHWRRSAELRPVARRGQSGLALIEILGALAVGAIMMIGLVGLMDASMADTKGQQTGDYQYQVTAAATKLMSAQYDTLAAPANLGKTLALGVSDLANAKLLPAGFKATNAYGQTPCILIRPSVKTVNGQPVYLLNALVVTEGTSTQAIPDKELGYIATLAGAGGGSLSKLSPTAAKGAYGAWTIDGSSAPKLSEFQSASCTGNVMAAGSLVSAIFYDGPGQLSTDFLYRHAQPGHPELNQMTTPLQITKQLSDGFIDADTSSDTYCVVADPTTFGKMAIDATGAVLSCQSGKWQRQGSAYWKDPVQNFSDLPATDNNVGDVRMVTSLMRAFSWNGGAWQALAVDQNGNMMIPKNLTVNNNATVVHRMTSEDIALSGTALNGAPCSTIGSISRDSNGALLTCKQGTWQNPRAVDVTGIAYSANYTVSASKSAPPPLNLSSIPGPRPLYISGYSYCFSQDSARIVVIVEAYDAAGNFVGDIGGCGIQSNTNAGLLTVKGVLPFQVLPNNAATLVFKMGASVGVIGSNSATLTFNIFNSN